MHADVHGAATCIIRNLSTGGTIPERTIEEAGVMSVSRSSAWKTKVLASAYWVYAHQVSKTPQPGEYVSTGGFIIRGKRNPIRVKKLEMAISVLFCLGDEESIKRHLPERNPSSQEDIPPRKQEMDEKAGQDEGQDTDDVNRGSGSRQSFGAADDEREGGQLSSNLSPPESATPSSHPGIDSAGSYLQLNSYEILPTPATGIVRTNNGSFASMNVQHVVFEDLPPKIFQIEAVDEDSSSGLSSSTPGKKKIGKYFDSRPDSADELPPPANYKGRTAPKDLLAKRTPETASVTLITRTSQSGDEETNPETGADWEVLLSDKLVDEGQAKEDYQPAGGTGDDGASSASSVTEERPAQHDSKSRDPVRPGKRTKEKRDDRHPASSKQKLKQQLQHQHLDKRTRRKLKLMKTKYGEQSDSEREMAQRFIGASKLKIEREDEEDEGKKQPSGRSPFQAISSPTPIPDRNVRIIRNDVSAICELQIADEPSDGEEDTEWKNRIEQLNELIGNPTEEDTLLFAIPVCAPWSAVEVSGPKTLMGCLWTFLEKCVQRKATTRWNEEGPGRTASL